MCYSVISNAADQSGIQLRGTRSVARRNETGLEFYLRPVSARFLVFAVAVDRVNATEQLSLFHCDANPRIFGAAALASRLSRAKSDTVATCATMLHKLRSTICIVTHLLRDTFPFIRAGVSYATDVEKKARSQR